MLHNNFTAPPSTCLNLAVNDTPNRNQLTVTWNRPDHPGRDDYYYNVYYSSTGDEGTFIQHNQVPYAVKEYAVSYTLTGLDPFTSYTIRVTVNNGVSDQDPAGIMNRTCEITIATCKKDCIYISERAIIDHEYTIQKTTYLITLGNLVCIIYMYTVPKDYVAQFDMLSGLALWNSTDGPTQYQIRYNRTEDGNHGNIPVLQVYYVDSGSKFTVEVHVLSNT